MPRPHKMADGTLVYVKKGWEPPAVPDGFKRKSNDFKNPDAWVMIPVLPPCSTRTSSEEQGSCGAIKIIYSCQGKRIVDLTTCYKCTERNHE